MTDLVLNEPYYNYNISLCKLLGKMFIPKWTVTSGNLCNMGTSEEDMYESWRLHRIATTKMHASHENDGKKWYGMHAKSGKRMKSGNFLFVFAKEIMHLHKLMHAPGKQEWIAINDLYCIKMFSNSSPK